MWKTLLCVGAGSFVGGIARYGLTGGSRRAILLISRWDDGRQCGGLPVHRLVVRLV